ncbi:MAG: hypothetical protein HN368_02340 [Spirochaetales bacterium]|jgi:hypothetical protein|nr:hypothetical protein [Spirochaetales bacterium]
MHRDDFVFTIGYDGDTAIVDKKAMKRYRKATIPQLIESGHYRIAFCSALFDSDEPAMAEVLAAYNRGEDTHYTSTDDLKRLFGVYDVHNDISKAKAL